MQKSRMPLNSIFRSPSFRAEGVKDLDVRTPQSDHLDRMNGNETFRRYADGKLDFQYAIDKIFEVLDKLRHKGHLTMQEQARLAVVFPHLGDEVPAAVANVQARLSDTEKDLIQFAVEAKLKEIYNYNAGRGGGSVNGRSETVV